MFVIDPKGVIICDRAIGDKPTRDAAEVTAAADHVAAALTTRGEEGPQVNLRLYQVCQSFPCLGWLGSCDPAASSRWSTDSGLVAVRSCGVVRGAARPEPPHVGHGARP